jgi:sugar phosphate isomerase/epimerase
MAAFTCVISALPMAEVVARKGSGKVRLGGPAFTSSADPEALAAAHRKLGYSAAYCPDVKSSDTDKIRAFEEAFSRHDVVIAEVGRWCNLMDADPELRKKNLETVTDGLVLADAIGALCCVDIAGSFNRESWFGPHPKNFSQEFFDLAVENARKIIDTAKPKRAKFAYEMMGWAIPATADQYLKLIKAIDRKAFAVHLDPCNAINSPEKIYANAALINECFDKLGKHVVSCHAKDLAWQVEMNVHFREVIPGTGVLDYETYLRRLSALPHSPPLMLEHLANAAEYAQGRDHILQVGKGIGIEFA